MAAVDEERDCLCFATPPGSAYRPPASARPLQLSTRLCCCPAANLMRTDGAVTPDQLYHDAPFHLIPPTGHFGLAHTTPQV
jgi:hypothetical protein